MSNSDIDDVLASRARRTLISERTSNVRSTADADRLLEAFEVAELLSVPTSWVRQQTREGLIPHLALGRYRRYSRDAIAEWLDRTAGQTSRRH